MDTINKIIDLQKGGMQDNEIVRELQGEGISPKEIRDAFGQATVKNAVYQEENFDSNPAGQSPQGMSPSIMQNPEAPQAEQQQQAQQLYAPEQNQQQVEAPEQNYYQQTPVAYSNQEGYAPQASSDMEVITEIAEQVTSEKIEDLKRKIGDIPSFKSEVKDSIKDLDERLRRIENSLDKIHQAIIGKIGEFGENTSLIQRDLGNIHQTMSKMMDPLMDNYKELRRIAGKE